MTRTQALKRLERVVDAEIEEESESLLRWWEGSTARRGLPFRPSDRTRSAQLRRQSTYTRQLRREQRILRHFRPAPSWQTLA